MGTASVTVEGNGNYKDQCTAAFQITSAGGKNLTVSSAPASLPYTGRGQEAAVTVKDGETVLAADTDYTLTYQAVTGTLSEAGKPLGAGAYDVVVTGQGNYAGDTGSASLVIVPAELGAVTVAEEKLVYDGSPKEPTVTVTGVDDSVLVKDTDYTVAYTNNTNAGIATVTVVGKGNYTGVKSQSFPVCRAVLAVTPTTVEKVYGSADELAYTVAAKADYALEGVLTREAGEDVGSYDFSVAALRETSGNYELVLAEDTACFAIQPKDVGETDVTQTGDHTVGYTGSPFDQSILTVYAAQRGNLLLGTADYTVSMEKDGTEVAEATEPGDYQVTVTGKGNYTGSYTFTLTIDAETLGVAFAAAGGDTVTYDGSDWAENMADRLTASFKGTSVALMESDLSFRQDGALVTELKEAGAYTIVISVAGYTDVELPFLILPKDIEELTVEGPADTVYNGKPQTPEVILEDDGKLLTPDVDFTLTYQGGTEAGTARVAIAGQGNYTGVRTESYTIAAKPLEDGDVGSLADVVFNGAPQLQKPDVSGLAEGRDYTLSYSEDQTNTGSVIVTVAGQGNYTGRVERSYSIAPKTLADSWLTVTPGQVTYTGSAQEPLVLVADGRTRLIQGTDYELAYQDNEDIGPAKVAATGKGNYSGKASGTFTIASNTAALTVELDRAGADYSGQNEKPGLSVSSGGIGISMYTASYTFNGEARGSLDENTQMVDAGVYAITVAGTESYAGATGTVTFVIRPGSFQVAPVTDQDYTGGPVTPLPTVTRRGDGEMLVQGVDYILSYTNNVALGEGTAAVTVVGLGNYAGTAITAGFTITGAHTLFHVTYDGNESTAGELPQDDRGYLAGTRAPILDGGGLSRLGAVLLGWSTRKEQLVATRPAQEALTILLPGQSVEVKADTVLYAVWATDSDHNGRPDYAEQVVITASAGEGGTIDPAGRQTVNWGEARVEYTITVSSGFTFSSLSVDGQRVPVSTVETSTALVRNGNGYTYVFTDVKEDHVILATFRQNGGGNTGGGGGGGSYTPQPQPEEPDDDDGNISPEESGVARWLDVENHTAFLEGRGDGECWPNAPMTRAEAAMMFYRLLKGKDIPLTTSFQDVSQDAWYNTAVYTLTSLGIMKGVGEGRFEPDRHITRSEFAVLISRMAKEVETGEVREYTDITPEDWFYGNVQLVSYYGWIAGYPDGSFGPQNNITRGEAAKIINAMTGRCPDREAIDQGLGVYFNDVTKNYWAFYEIIEAATTHSYQHANGKEVWEDQSNKNKQES